ncbi:MAG: hypothetical protein ABSE84_09815 [Isosphaeraceae bacterium]|jgi:hypothetical protein
MKGITVTVKFYCLCGATVRGTMPADLAEALAEIWSKEHTGAGHGKATPQQASRARAKYDQIAARKANP